MTTDITELAQSLKATAEKAFDHSVFTIAVDAYSVIALVEALEKAQQADDELCKLLPPGVEYMDPPDGGDVEPIEQVRRMVADYRQRIAELESRTVTVKLPVSLDFDCEMENGDYDIDEEPYLRGKVDGFNYALTKVRRLNGTTGIKWEAE